ncbi:MAG: flagellar basal body protein, partial [Oscillospiraceae bacterium]
MLRSTFYSFTTASRALALNQKSLDTVGQNISNMGTLGYTRQRVDRYSVSSSKSGMYGSSTDVNIGQGVEMASLSQARDPFLDIRFRKEAPKVGELDAALTVLEDLETVFDETTMDGLSSQMSDMLKQLQTLSSKTGNPEFDGIVKTSAELLTKLFNQFSDKLQATRKEQEYNLESIAVPKVNDLLKGLKEVTASIRKEQLNGSPALELLDQKNVLIDELSQYIKIDVKTTNVVVSPGLSYEETTINLVDDAGNPTVLLDPKNGNRDIVAQKDANGQYEIFVANPDGTLPTTASTITTGNFKGYLDMLNKSGEFDGAGENVRGIGYYEGMLDNLAVTFATEMNKLNSSIKNDKYDPKDPSKGPEFLVLGGPLFTNKDALQPPDQTDGITSGTSK